MAKEQGLRQRRVSAEISHVLSMILAREFGHHPVLGTLALTVVHVDISPDLRHAGVAVLPLGGTTGTGAESRSENPAWLQALRECTPLVRKHLAGALSLRVVPHLTFRYATGQDAFAGPDPRL